MGRGRQKAKDAKIARELKYTNHGGDLRALERELLHGSEATGAAAAPAAVDTAVVEDDDLYDRWATDDDDEDEDGGR